MKVSISDRYDAGKTLEMARAALRVSMSSPVQDGSARDVAQLADDLLSGVGEWLDVDSESAEVSQIGNRAERAGESNRRNIRNSQ